MLVAIAGKMRSGKDTSARALVRDLGFKQIAFADKLRDFTAEFLYPDEPDLFGPGYVRMERFKTDQFFRGLIHDDHDMTGRQILQRLGTAARRIFGQDFWVDAALGHVSTGDVVVSDARYLSEVAGVRNRGGLVIRVNRADGWADGTTHASETELPDTGPLYDHVITGKTAEDTAEQVVAYVRNYLEE